MTTILRNADFKWLGLEVCWRNKPVLALIADATYPHLYRIGYPDGWISSPANLTRAKDAVYGHARYLVAQENRVEASYSPFSSANHLLLEGMA
jgi:hypothetical protein